MVDSSEERGGTNCQKWTFELPDLEQRRRSKGQIAESIRTGNITQIATMIWNRITSPFLLTVATGICFPFRVPKIKFTSEIAFLMLLVRIPVEKKR